MEGDDDIHNKLWFFIFVRAFFVGLFCLRNKLGKNKLYLEKVEKVSLVTIISSHPWKSLVEPTLINN